MFRLGDRSLSRSLDNPSHRISDTDSRRPRDFVTENHEVINKEAEFLRKLVKPAEGELNCAEQAFYDKAHRRLWMIRREQQWVNNQKDGFNAKHAFLMAYEDTSTPMLKKESSTSIGFNIDNASKWKKIAYIDRKRHPDDFTIQQQVLQNLKQEAYRQINTVLDRLLLSVYTKAESQALDLLKTAQKSQDGKLQATISDKTTLYTSLGILKRQKADINLLNTTQDNTSIDQVIKSIKDIDTTVRAIGTKNQAIAAVANFIRENPILSSFL